MPPSVTILSPMPQSYLPNNFMVCGTAIFQTVLVESKKGPTDRNEELTNTPGIQVTVTKGGTTYGPFDATFCVDDPSRWEASVEDVPADDLYTLTATLTQGSNTVSHSIEWVHVQNGPVVAIAYICCGANPPPQPVNPFRVLALGTLKSKEKLVGKFKGTIDDVFGSAWSLNVTKTVTGGNVHVVYQLGSPVHPGKYGTFHAGNKTFELVDVEVDANTVVVVCVKRNGKVIGQTTSALY
jgi:hypothetical protein